MSAELHVIFGTGPLGHWTAKTLLALGRRVRMVNRSGTSAAAPAGAELAQGDAYDQTSVRQLTAGATAVYQCAQPPYHQWEGNFPRLQQRILEGAAAAGAKLIVAENLYAYGEPAGKAFTEQTPYAAHTKKGRIRQAMTEALFAAHRRGDLRVASARGSDFFGPHDQISHQMIFQPALRGRRLTMLGRLDQPHTFTYVADFGRALATLGTDDRGLGRPWHVPSAPPVTQAQLAALLAELLGRPVRASGAGALLLRLVDLASPAVAESVEMLYEWSQPFVMDSRDFSQTFGSQPTPLRDALGESLAWSRAQLGR
ncbi:NAD-dependent epimerase/dehydratase family protein [Chloroflexia bacterium SDU3-3]|nr:NAD-dependent epimerase/dehydratase family protein [Chloroflexia bacterium SDU3-3]